MFIRQVDDALEAMLRAAVPLPREAGDVTFEPPTSAWSAQLSRLTISLFLYEVRRSNEPSRALTHRVDQRGRPEIRSLQPMIELNYLVSAWAGGLRDEHQLLSDVVSRVAGIDSVPQEFVPPELDSSLSIGIGNDERNRLREIWSAAGGQLKASFTLQVGVAAQTFDWRAAPPSVESIEALTRPGVGPVLDPAGRTS